MVQHSHIEHDVGIQGTDVVPESPVSVIIVAAAIGSIVAVMTVAKRMSFFNKT
jgi:hypothetical protein